MSRYSDLILSDNPVGYWRLGESEGATVAEDETVNGYDGSYEGLPLLGGDGVISEGMGDTAADFDGLDDYVVSNLVAPTFESAFSLEFWAKTTHSGVASGETAGPIVVGVGDSASSSIWVGVQFNQSVSGVNDSFIKVHVATSLGGDATEYNTAQEHRDGNWHHYVFTYDGTNLVIHMDGVEVASTSTTVGFPSGLDYFIIGGLQRGAQVEPRYLFPGTLDEVVVYDHILTAQQAKEHHDVGRYGAIRQSFDDSSIITPGAESVELMSRDWSIVRVT